MRRPLILTIAILASPIAPTAAYAQACQLSGSDVTSEDGRRGILSGTAIIWSDGTRSHSATPHPSVIIGNKASVHVGPGVFVGTGRGSMPLDNPNASNKTQCAIVNGVSYC